MQAVARRQVLGQRGQVGVSTSVADERGPLGDGGPALVVGRHERHVVEQLPHGVEEILALDGPVRHAGQRLGERAVGQRVASEPVLEREDLARGSLGAQLLEEGRSHAIDGTSSGDQPRAPDAFDELPGPPAATLMEFLPRRDR